ncbi:MAG: hypothetical protein ACTHMR_00610 [Thermomicrobiales bacterium]
MNGAHMAAGESVTMQTTTLTTVVRAVRLRYAVLFVLLLGVVYWTGIHPWMMNWGSTVSERQMVLPGDDLHPNGAGRTTQAITINAPDDAVWPWLVQVGQDRAGFYTYTWLENLTGADIHNANAIHPEWQHLAVGDAWRLVPPEYLFGLGKGAVTPVLLVEPGHALVLQMWGAYVIEPIDAHTTRLLVRGYATPAGPVARLMTTMVLDPLVFTMSRPMLLGLKARAEGHPAAPTALMAVAWLGWAIAGIAVAGLFLRQRRRYWLTLPAVAALPALLAAHDLQAGLAAFLAAGITTLGFLTFGRSWWGSFLIIGSLVLLTLLLAPDAYIALGLAFALVFLAAGGAIVATRAGALGGASRQMAATAR